MRITRSMGVVALLASTVVLAGPSPSPVGAAETEVGGPVLLVPAGLQPTDEPEFYCDPAAYPPHSPTGANFPNGTMTFRASGSTVCGTTRVSQVGFVQLRNADHTAISGCNRTDFSYRDTSPHMIESYTCTLPLATGPVSGLHVLYTANYSLNKSVRLPPGCSYSGSYAVNCNVFSQTT